MVVLDEAAANALAAAMKETPFAVRSVERKPYTRKPAAPFMTSTLQQEASRKQMASASQLSELQLKLSEQMRADGWLVIPKGINALETGHFYVRRTRVRRT